MFLKPLKCLNFKFTESPIINSNVEGNKIKVLPYIYASQKEKIEHGRAANLSYIVYCRSVHEQYKNFLFY